MFYTTHNFTSSVYLASTRLGVYSPTWKLRVKPENDVSTDEDGYYTCSVTGLPSVTYISVTGHKIITYIRLYLTSTLFARLCIGLTFQNVPLFDSRVLFCSTPIETNGCR